MAIDYPPQTYARLAVVARVKAAFLEGYDAMRHQYSLGEFAEDAWDTSASKRLLGEPARTEETATKAGVR